jgi:hypothetical protein
VSGSVAPDEPLVFTLFLVRVNGSPYLWRQFITSIYPGEWPRWALGVSMGSGAGLGFWGSRMALCQWE